MPDAPNPVLEYVKKARESFERDPADSDYQHGYQAALDDILREADSTTPSWADR